jgi:hypothetical protein
MLGILYFVITMMLTSILRFKHHNSADLLILFVVQIE